MLEGRVVCHDNAEPLTNRRKQLQLGAQFEAVYSSSRSRTSQLQNLLSAAARSKYQLYRLHVLRMTWKVL